MEHNFDHWEIHLCFNVYILTLIAFYMHQIFELTNLLYKACRKRFGSKRFLWEKLRSYADLLIFKDWEHLLDFTLKPKTGVLSWTDAEAELEEP